MVRSELLIWIASGIVMLEEGLLHAKKNTEIPTKNEALIVIPCIIYSTECFFSVTQDCHINGFSGLVVITAGTDTLSAAGAL